MKIFGWLYLVLFFANIFIAFARKLGFGDAFTIDAASPLVLLSLPVFILSITGKLKPKRVYIALSTFMFIFVGQSVILYRLVYSKVLANSPQHIEGQTALSYLKKEIWWYEFVSQIPTYSMLLIFLLAVYLYVRGENVKENA